MQSHKAFQINVKTAECAILLRGCIGAKRQKKASDREENEISFSVSKSRTPAASKVNLRAKLSFIDIDDRDRYQRDSLEREFAESIERASRSSRATTYKSMYMSIHEGEPRKSR